MKQVHVVSSQIKHDGKRYAIGDKIELDDEAAAKLLSRGLIGEALKIPEPKAPDAPKAPDVPKVPDVPKAPKAPAPKVSANKKVK